MEENREAPVSLGPDDRRRMTYDLMRRLLSTVDEWGKAQGRRDLNQMRSITVDALLKTIAAICAYKELSSMRVSHKNVNIFLQRIFKEEPIEADEPEMLLTLRARKDVLFRNLERVVRAF
jgi:hypothetical protein